MKLNERKPSRNYRAFVLALITISAVGAAHATIFGSVEAASAEKEGAIQIESPATTFPADAATLGAIPDGPGTPTTCGSDGAAKNVTFTVSGISGSPTNIELEMTLAHPWAGDVTAILIAPNGASHTLFGYTGSIADGGCGDSSDLAGTYRFADSAVAPPSGGWWQEASIENASTALSPGTYRTTAKGGAGAVNPQPPTSISSSFAGVAVANGTWTLRLFDGGNGDTGSISAASLTMSGGAPATPQKPPVDFNGDGRSDFAVVRNTGGGSNGQVSWFINNAVSPTDFRAVQWGLASDYFVPVDYDGDGKTDIAVWRPTGAGDSSRSYFYILQSNGNTFRAEQLGSQGDNPTVVGDYDGDGKADVAVYRAGATSGAQSYWFYRPSATPGVNFRSVPWGINGDFVAPGDYDGDGKADFCVQRNAGGGNAQFILQKSAGGVEYIIWGTPTDVIVPNDYDGDGKTDFMVVRNIGSQLNWYLLTRAGVASTAFSWGASATDFPAPGDYDADGKVDIAVWRQTSGEFYVRRSSNGAFQSFKWGSNGDYPLANYNSH